MAKKPENGKKGKVLDLNAKILISIRDELREHSSILNQHTSILCRLKPEPALHSG
jgi:hypothetical protein